MLMRLRSRRESTHAFDATCWALKHGWETMVFICSLSEEAECGVKIGSDEYVGGELFVFLFVAFLLLGVLFFCIGGGFFGRNDGL
jgi:hypothetical protein